MTDYETRILAQFMATAEGETQMSVSAVGEKAPQFTLPDADGKKVKLSDFKGKKVILYFYPRDLTPGCTKEACGFRDDLPKFEKQPG